MPEMTVAGSLDELLAGATERTPLEADDGKSGAHLEWVVIDGERFVLKILDLRTDWTMHAAFWEGGDELELVPMGNRYLILGPGMSENEAEIGTGAFIPELVGRGWRELPNVAPRLAEVVLPLAWDPSPLVAAYGSTPMTLLHGNWKLGNLGTDDHGRSVVIEWEDPGRGPAAVDLAWYLAINAARLPHSKDAAMAAYRAGLDRRGIDTEPWWDRQMALALIGAMVHFGWEKALSGRNAELEWWEEHVVEAAPLLA